MSIAIRVLCLMSPAAARLPSAGSEFAASWATGCPNRGCAGAVVLFLGTSLTAGYGLEPDQAYPALIQAQIDSAGLPYRVINAG